MNASKELYDKERNERFAKALSEKVYTSLTDIESPTYMKLFVPNKGGVNQDHHWGLTGFPMNGASQAFLALEAIEKGYEGRAWFRYDQAHQAGGQVKANEKSVMIKDYNRKLSQSFFPSLFNADQIKGLPEVTQAKKPDIGLAKDKALILADASKIPVAYVSTRQEAGYDGQAGVINLAPMDAFQTDGLYHAHVIKALAQSTAHPDMMGRFVGDSLKQKAMEAFRVNVASTIMCERIGLPFELGGDSKYTKVWAEVAQQEPEQIVKVFSDAERMCYQLGVFAHRLNKTPLVEQTDEMKQHKEKQQEKIAEIEEASQEEFRQQAKARTNERNKEREKQLDQEVKTAVKRTRKQAQEQAQAL